VELREALDGDAGKLVSFSNHFSLVEMVEPTWPGTLGMSTDEIAKLHALGVTPIAWASLAAGYVSGRDDRSWDSPENEERRRRAQQLAAERGTTATTVALAYVLNQPVRVLAAVGTRSESHLDELLGAATLPLDTEDVSWLSGQGER
jgi:aryl-alcohol dehydrogenase-like predicted oxidoreductase